MGKSLALVKLLRPEQWVKNLFLFIPVFFSGELSDQTRLEATFFAFIAFCLTASAIYIINDINDIEADRQHPAKHKRPLASGDVSLSVAWVIFVITLLASASIVFLLANLYFGLIVSFYLLLNIAYTF